MRATSVEAHSDYLNITIPYVESGGFEQTVLDAVALSHPNPSPGKPGLYVIGVWGKQEGTLKFVRRGDVYVTSVSGLALMFMRMTACFNDFLWCFADRPHRVSHLDAALDVVDVDAGQEVLTLYRRGMDDGLRLSQRVAPVSCHFARGAHGDETGTVYIGGKNARIRLVAYDKRQERIVRGHPDPGPLLRYELRFRGGENGVPLTLRDAANPTAVFWHHVPENILMPPIGVEPAPWLRCESVGFDLPPREERAPDVPLRRWAEHVGTHGVALADKLGPHGRNLLAVLMGLSGPARARR